MKAPNNYVEDVLDAILRGSAKILGCNSTNLILFNEKTQEIRFRFGMMAVSYPLLFQTEQLLLGASFHGLELPLSSARDSMVHQSWWERTTLETSSLRELVGTAFPADVVAQVEELIGDRRFACVPALSGSRNYGVLLFEKHGKHPYSRQQLALLQRYARRIGEIVENDLMAQGQSLFAQPTHGPEYVLFDASGAMRGVGHRGVEPLLTELDDEIRRLVRQVAAAEPAAPAAAEDGRPAPLGGAVTSLELEQARLDLTPFELGAERCVLGVLRREGQRSGALGNQLLQLTLGDPAPALFVDPDYRLTSCNEAGEQLFGYTTDELWQAPIGQLFRNEREILDILSPHILDPTNPYHEESVVIVRKDGALASVRAQALLLADDMDRVDGYLVVLRPRADEPQPAVELPQHLSTMSEMTAQLAHEIRNPLLAVGATLESVARDELGDDQRAIITAAAQEIARLDAVLQSYLAARHELAVADVSLPEVVGEARDLLAAAHEVAGKRVHVAIDAGLTVRGDYSALRDVFFNLLLNALEASPDDGEVACRADAGQHAVSVFVEDRGEGLHASAERCFQPFFTTKDHGTGLGLAVCQKIARAHGGLIQLADRPGGGTQAVVVLPRRFPPMGQPTS